MYICTAMRDDENVLRLIPGDVIGAASNTLPPAEACEDAFREATIEVPTQGFTARIRFNRLLQRWRKHRRWFWTAESASRVEE